MSINPISINPINTFSISQSQPPPAPRKQKPSNSSDKVELIKPKMQYWLEPTEETPKEEFLNVEYQNKEYLDPLTPFKQTQKTAQKTTSATARNLFTRPAKKHKNVPVSAPALAPAPVPKDTLFSTLHTRLGKEGKIYYKKSDHEVTFLNKGHYCAVYQFIENPNLLVKAYHGGTDYKFDPIVLRKLLHHSLQSYDTVVSLGLPVAELVNKATAESDGFFVQNKIPHPIDVKNSAHIENVSKFFTASVQQKVPMDLHPENLRANQDGTVVLIDFIEEPEELFFLITEACREWTALLRKNKYTLDQARSTLTTITAGFLNTHPDYSTAWLENILKT